MELKIYPICLWLFHFWFPTELIERPCQTVSGTYTSKSSVCLVLLCKEDVLNTTQREGQKDLLLNCHRACKVTKRCVSYCILPIYRRGQKWGVTAKGSFSLWLAGETLRGKICCLKCLSHWHKNNYCSREDAGHQLGLLQYLQNKKNQPVCDPA